MANQDQSSKASPTGEEGKPSPEDYRGDGPAKIGLNSDDQPDLVSPSGVNERDHGAAGDKPMAGDSLNFEDGEISRPYGNTERTGGTWNDKNPSDAGKLGGPDTGMSPGLSDHNGPSDPDAKRGR